MHRDDDGNVSCQEVVINTFVAGAVAGAGLEEAFSYEQGDLGDVPGESNGIAFGLTAGIGYSSGFDWDAETGKVAVAFGIGTGKIEAEGAYNHSWVSVGDMISCSNMDWYAD